MVRWCCTPETEGHLSGNEVRILDAFTRSTMAAFFVDEDGDEVAMAVGTGCGVCRDFECLHIQGLGLPGWGVKHDSGAEEVGVKVGSDLSR